MAPRSVRKRTYVASPVPVCLNGLKYKAVGAGVSEETAGAESAPENPGAGVDPVAVALALGGASREEADAFLKDQRKVLLKQGALIDDQRHHLHEQFKHLHLSVWEKQLGVLLRVATAVVGIAVATAIGIVVWKASRADGTLVDAFSVPPQFAQVGITGEVVADDLTSRIGAIRDIAVNNSISSSRDIRQDSAEDIKVEIPETGVSLGQAWRYLREWLGHEHHLSGNLRLIGEGKIALTAAVDGETAAAVSGASGDLDKLEQQVAEQVFARVDPTNIVLYLRSTRRGDEALAAAERGAQLADGPVARSAAYALWADMFRLVSGDMPLAAAHARLATEINPKLITGHRELMWASFLMGHDEEALRQAQLMRSLREDDLPLGLQGRGFAEMVAEGVFERDAALGDFAHPVSQYDCSSCVRVSGGPAEFAARAHDGAASRSLAAETAPISVQGVTRMDIGIGTARVRYFSAAMVDDWPAAIASARAYAQIANAGDTVNPGLKTARLRTQVPPLLAYALARSGDIAGAQAVIDATPGDCYDCVRARGIVAALAGQPGRADYWFARAVESAPSIPFAYADWSQALMSRGDMDGAIAKFTVANQKGPHFADPLEMWGEALMAKNQSHLALAKFAEAEKYAPNWGRLHLKWGEALVYAGRRDEARAQYQKASTLDLTAADRAELTQVSSHG
jgi:hypothetical protein